MPTLGEFFLKPLGILGFIIAIICFVMAAADGADPMAEHQARLDSWLNEVVVEKPGPQNLVCNPPKGTNTGPNPNPRIYYYGRPRFIGSNWAVEYSLRMNQRAFEFQQYYNPWNWSW